MMQSIKKLQDSLNSQIREFHKQKFSAYIISVLKKGFEFSYLILSLFIGIFYIFTIPFWAPFVFFKTAMSRCFNFTKRVYDLPTEIFKPKLIQPIRYAILKRNGKYLRGDWEDPLLFQLYDYTLRKFLNIEEIQPNLKIAEVECESLSQWKYFRENGVKNVKALQSNPSFLQKQKETYSQIQLLQQNYQKKQFPNDYDCMVAFNIKQKLDKFWNKIPNTKNQKIDIMKILDYIQYHLVDNGYVVYGEFFQEQGEIEVMQDLFKAYGFKVEQNQNIQRNIAYAEKLRTEKIKNVFEIQLLEKFSNLLKKLFGLKRDYSKGYFIVFILSKKQQ